MRKVYIIQKIYIRYDTHGLVPREVVAAYSSLAKANENVIRLIKENDNPCVDYKVHIFPVC